MNTFCCALANLIHLFPNNMHLQFKYIFKTPYNPQAQIQEAVTYNFLIVPAWKNKGKKNSGHQVFILLTGLTTFCIWAEKPLTGQCYTVTWSSWDWPQVTGPDSSQQQGAEIYNGGLVGALKRSHNDIFDNRLPDFQWGPACQRSRAKYMPQRCTNCLLLK